MYGGNANNVTIQQQPVSQLGPLPSGRETRLTITAREYFVDYNTKLLRATILDSYQFRVRNT